MIDETRFIERPSFFNGQRLHASDLQDVEAFNREMRQVHNQSLHSPGVGKGCSVYGKKGDRLIIVQPGYVLDTEGHEIIITETHHEPVPPVAGDESGGPAFYDLTVSYPRDEDLEEAETRAGICLPRDVVRLREAPVFCWVRLMRTENDEYQPKNTGLKSDIEKGRKIALARVMVLNCQLNEDISVEVRRNARPQQVPYVASGVATPVWKLMTRVPFDSSDTEIVGLLASVDTRSAGFGSIPIYFGRMVGPGLENILGLRMVDGFSFIQDVSQYGFTFAVKLSESSRELRLDSRSADSFLFSINSEIHEVRTDLNSGKVTARIVEVFHENNVDLTEGDRVEKFSNDGEWVVDVSGTLYYIRATFSEREGLEVYLDRTLHLWRIAWMGIEG